jgi:hypothetical protein
MARISNVSVLPHAVQQKNSETWPTFKASVAVAAPKFSVELDYPRSHRRIFLLKSTRREVLPFEPWGLGAAEQRANTDESQVLLATRGELSRVLQLVDSRFWVVYIHSTLWISKKSSGQWVTYPLYAFQWADFHSMDVWRRDITLIILINLRAASKNLQSS